MQCLTGCTLLASDSDSAASAIFLVLLLVFVVVVIAILAMQANNRNRRDSAAESVLREGLLPLVSGSDIQTTHIGNRTTPDYPALQLGEVSRHFDSNTSASITGWLTHNLGFHGWGLGIEAGRFGIGLGTSGLGGTSEVNLTLRGTTRDNLMSDGFVAVVEHDTPTGRDTVRVVVPSEQEAREFVSALVDGVMAAFTEADRNGKTTIPDPLSRATVERAAPHLLAFPSEASYISDRLHSAMRMSEDSRPVFGVWGSKLSPHAVLGSAIRIGADGPVISLFPLELVTRISSVAHEALVQIEGTQLPLDTDAEYYDDVGARP